VAWYRCIYAPRTGGAHDSHHRTAGIAGAAAAWPLAARAQQPAVPVIGFLVSRGPGDTPELLAAFRQGLKDTGFIEGQNIAIEYRFAGNQNERLPALAADLVQRQVSVIAAPTTPAALAAKTATMTIPIVFETGSDPSGSASSPALIGRAATSRA